MRHGRFVHAELGEMLASRTRTITTKFDELGESHRERHVSLYKRLSGAAAADAPAPAAEEECSAWLREVRGLAAAPASSTA